eukprot:evm.model.scf_365.4 EVM.evm.TU.scf_365.4   scf_365:67193-68017(-)
MSAKTGGLLALHAATAFLVFVQALGESRTGSGGSPKCSSLRGTREGFPDAIFVTETTLNRVGNDLQIIVDCCKKEGAVFFDVPVVRPASVIAVNKAIEFRAANGSETTFACPSGGTVFDIR